MQGLGINVIVVVVILEDINIMVHSFREVSLR